MINILSVSKLYNVYKQNSINNFINNSIITSTNTVSIPAFKLFISEGPGVKC